MPYKILRGGGGDAAVPGLVFADEVTSGLDLVTQEQTVDALMSEVCESGAALLLVTRDTDLSAAVADREIAL